MENVSGFSFARAAPAVVGGGKRSKSVLGGWVGRRTVRKLLPLESEVLLYLLCPLTWEASSSLSS